MFSYFTKILKSSEYQSVLKVYYLTKNRQKWVKQPNIRKLQITDYQCNIFLSFLLFYPLCTGSEYKIPIVNSRFTIGILWVFDTDLIGREFDSLVVKVCVFMIFVWLYIWFVNAVIFLFCFHICL